jgi:hypothetical protein
MRTPSRQPSARWPFWLLIAAWVCANSPQAATYAVLTWMAEARSFTHQQQLTFDVAHLLTGEEVPSKIVMAAAANNEQAPEPLPAVPSGAVIKKIDLSAENTATLVRAAVISMRQESRDDRRDDALRAPPPHGPPRGIAIV